MVWCQIQSVSKLILHRLTLHWLHKKSMKINKSTRSHFYYFTALTLLYHAVSSAAVAVTHSKHTSTKGR